MENKMIREPDSHSARPWRFLGLVAVFIAIIGSIILIRQLPDKESQFVDNVAAILEHEIDSDRFTISSGNHHRTIVDFQAPIIEKHGSESKLIVYTAEISETTSVSSVGFLGEKISSTVQDIIYTGTAEYTINLSALSEDCFSVNNEEKTLTVRIPYVELKSINTPPEQMQFKDVKKTLLGPKEVTLTPEQSAQLRINVQQKMKAKLIDESIIDIANKSAKETVEKLFSGIVHSVDPEFSVVIVQ